MEFVDQFWINNIFMAMEEGDEMDNDYLVNVAIAASEAVKTVKLVVGQKNNCDSEFYREEGNNAYKNAQLQKALVSYNKALAYAPNDSLSLKFAYSNRSAVLWSAGQYEDCERDCDTALAIKCTTPTSLTDKLRKRKSQATNEKEREKMLFNENQMLRSVSDDYFKLKSQNIEIPCAIADIEVVTEFQIPKVIAKHDITAGTLVALEKSFVSWAANESDQYISCHYCRKLDLNLFPCSGCVVAMFCSKKCEKSCLSEYHAVECQIIGAFLRLDPNCKYKWIVQVLIKLRNTCSSWDELISMSYKYGFKRIKDSTVNEIYDVNNPTSLLSFKDDRHFLHGAIFKSSVICGMFLNTLQNLDSFIPQDWTRKLSVTKAMARVMMYLAVHGPTTVLPLVTTVACDKVVAFYKHGQKGIFPFVGKLKHSCVPNLQTIAVNDSVALIASETIKAGTELTVSQIFHWLENNLTKPQRKMNLIFERFIVCSCFVCISNDREWQKNKEETKASPAQKKAVMDCFSLDDCQLFGIPLKRCLEQIHEAKACLKDIPFSAEYEKSHKLLLRTQMTLLHSKLRNVTLSRDF